MLPDVPPDPSLKRARFSSHRGRDESSRWRLWVRARLRGGGTRLKFYWGRILVFLGVLAVAGWLGTALAAYLFLQRKHDFADISYLNIVLPHRWPEHRRALGRHYVTKAREALKEGNFADAFHFFSAGVARVPDDLEARTLFAALNSRVGRAPQAARLLVDGLPHGHGDAEYVRRTFALLFEQQREEDALQLAARHLSEHPQSRTAGLFALQQATAYFRLGQYDAAEQTAARWQLGATLEGALLLARCEWERGYPELAILRLERKRETFPTRDEIPLQLIRFYRELGEHKKALQESLVRTSADPLSPGPRIDLVNSYYAVGDTPQYRREVDRFFRDFGRDPMALLLLARLSATLGEVDVARLTRQRAAEVANVAFPFEICELEALVSAERYAEAAPFAEALQATYPANTPPGRLILGWRAAITYALRDATKGEILLQTYAGDPTVRANEALPMVGVLERVGATAAARHLLVALLQRQPQHQGALTRLVQLDAAQRNIAGLEEYLPRLVAMGKPSRAVLQEAFSTLNDGTPARAALRRSVAEAVQRLTANPEPGK